MSDGGVALRSITVGADEDPAEAPAREAAVVVLAAGAVVADADRTDRPGGQIESPADAALDVRDDCGGGSVAAGAGRGRR
jgi:hypothetical protein